MEMGTTQGNNPDIGDESSQASQKQESSALRGGTDRHGNLILDYATWQPILGPKRYQGTKPGDEAIHLLRTRSLYDNKENQIY